LHRSAPFQVTGGDEVLAETRRAAEVHAHHRIAAVGEPLVVGIETEAVAPPRATVDKQYHRHRRIGHPVGITVTARRQGEIADQRLAVARRDLERMHRLEWCSDQIGPRGIKFRQGVGGAIVEPGFGGCGDRIVGDDPASVVVGSAGYGELAVELGIKPVQRSLHLRVERVPVCLEILDRIRLDLAGHRVRQRPANVSSGIFGQDRALAGRGIDPDQRRGVPAAAVDPVQGLTVGGVAGRRGGERILQTGSGDRLGGDFAVMHLEVVVAARRVWLDRHPQRQRVVGQEPGVAIVLHHLRHLACAEIEQIDVVKARIAVVETDQQLVLLRGRAADQRHPRLVERSQCGLRAAGDVDRVKQEILVPALVLYIKQASAVR